MIPFWYSADGSPTAWDGARIGGTYVPGRFRCTVDPSRNVEAVQGEGEDGVTLKDHGYVGAGVAMEITVWDPLHLPELAACLAAWSPKRPGAVASPVDFSHPAGLLTGVSRIYIEGFTVPPPESGLLTVSVRAREWFPSEAVKKTQQSGTSQGGLPGGDGGPLGPPDVPDPDPENLGPDIP